MSSPAKRKGTVAENEALTLLQTIWPGAHRTHAGSPANDITGCDGLQAVEVKHRARWLVQSWVFEQKRQHRDRWAIFVMDGDRRKGDAAPDIVVLPRPLALEALAAWDRERKTQAFGKPARKTAFDGGIDPEYGEQLHMVDL